MGRQDCDGVLAAKLYATVPDGHTNNARDWRDAFDVPTEARAWPRQLSVPVTVPVVRDTLRAAYGQSNLTQAQIAARAGVSENTVYRVLSGRAVHTDSLLAVAAALGLEIQFQKSRLALSA